MRVFYDTEFLEAGPGEPVRLISIGLVRDDGAEYYAVSDEATKRPLSGMIRKNEWLMANVVPSLPKAFGDMRMYQPKRWLFNYSDPCVKARSVIAREVRDFILGRDADIPHVELWADWAAYDHVVLCQLWGRMADLPEGIPMWTHDLRQEIERLEVSAKDVPAMPGQRAHNALGDAREVKYRYEWLASRAKPQTGLDRAAEAIRKSRGGDPPAQIRGFALWGCCGSLPYSSRSACSAGARYSPSMCCASRTADLAVVPLTV